jgi:hypothetical protein
VSYSVLDDWNREYVETLNPAEIQVMHLIILFGRGAGNAIPKSSDPKHYTSAKTQSIKCHPSKVY